MKAQIASRVIAVALPIAVASSLFAAPQHTDALTPNQTTAPGVVQALNADINYFWWWTFSYYGWNYTAPAKYVWYDGAGLPTTVNMPGCGQTGPDNSYYCSADHVIYLDKNWNQSLVNKYGDFGQAFVLIHEWSHHIQTVRPGNWMKWAGDNKLFAGRELQADCFAGIYTRYLAKIGKLAPGDLDEALAWIARYGDQAGVNPYTLEAHGTAAQRRAWFLTGYNNYNLTACDGVYKTIYG